MEVEQRGRIIPVLFLFGLSFVFEYQNIIAAVVGAELEGVAQDFDTNHVII